MGRFDLVEKFKNKTKEEILEILSNDSIGTLFRDLETIGRFVPEDIAVPILSNYVLNHADPVVREGALNGLAIHDEKEEVREVICKVFKNDTHIALREMAWDLIEDYHDMICEDIKECICHYGD